MIATIGRSGTRQGFYDKKGGYKLHFEVLQSKDMLDWACSGPLDFRCVSETWRIDPVKFLSRTSKGYGFKDREIIDVKMTDGTRIICGSARCVRFKKNGDFLEAFLRTELPNSGVWVLIVKLINFVGLGIGTVGPIMNPRFPLTLDNFTHPGATKYTDEEVNNAIYNFVNKTIDPENINRSGLYSSNPFAEAFGNYDKPDTKK